MPNGVRVVSVRAVLIVLRVAGAAAAVFSTKGPTPTVIEVSVGVPTIKPAAVIVALAVESAVPCSYCRLGRFSNSDPNCLLELSYLSLYCFKSPIATQVLAANLTSVAPDH